MSTKQISRTSQKKSRRPAGWLRFQPENLGGITKTHIRNLLTCILVVGIASVTAVAHASVTLLDDTFNSENGGVGWAGSYTGFANWTVTAGSVDLAGYGSWNFLNTSGSDVYVDLDGSTYQAGTLRSKDPFHLTLGTYLLQFDLAGSHRGADEGGRTNVVRVTLGNWVNDFVLASEDPFSTYAFAIDITADTNAYLSFQNLPDEYVGDNIGALLDNVKLTTAVPEPASLALLGIGLAGLGAMRRRTQTGARAQMGDPFSRAFA